MTVRLQEDSVEDAAARCWPLIPANPGFELLVAYVEDDGETIFADPTPIIGWRLSHYGCPEPIATGNHVAGFRVVLK